MTNSRQCTAEDNADVYLAWDDMKWEITGNVRTYEESRRKICEYQDGITDILLSGKVILFYYYIIIIILLFSLLFIIII